MAQPSEAQTEIVRLAGICKAFGSIVALSDVDLSLNRGEIHALLGENGAGKSTLMNILYGLIGIDSGQIRIGGEDASRGWSTRKAIAAGIGMVHQHFSLVGEYTVLENVVLPTLRWSGRKIEWEGYRARLETLCDSYGMNVSADTVVEKLSVGERQQVEILKMLFQGARILILDEPTSVLTPQQAENLLHTLTRFREDGYSVVIITHKLGDAMRIADRITVLRHGRKIGEARPKTASVEDIARMMVAQSTGPTNHERHEPEEELVFKTNGLVVAGHGRPAVDDVSFDLRQGEILGIAGVAGNGQSELAEALLGLRPLLAGQIMLGSRDITGASVMERRARGLSFIAEDRHAMSMVGDMDIASNLVLEKIDQKEFQRLGVIDRGAVNDNARRLITEFDVRAKSPSVKMRTLSGGNQQKVVVARELSANPKAIIVSEPSRGLDFAATNYVRGRLMASAAAGASILLISSDLDELLMLSHRVAVMYRGKIVGILDACDFDVDRIGLMMAGMGKESGSSDARSA